MALNVSNILDQHSELIEEEIFKLFCLMYDASDNFTLFRDFFINSSEPERIQIFVRFLQKNGAKGKKWCFFLVVCTFCYLLKISVFFFCFFSSTYRFWCL